MITNTLFNLIFLLIIFSNFLIFLLKICFSDLFLSSQVVGIEVVFFSLGFFISFPFFLSYESLYKAIKKKIFTKSLEFLIRNSISISFGFIFSGFFLWSIISTRFNSLLNKFFIINTIHFLSCVFFLVLLSKFIENQRPLTNKLSILLAGLARQNFDQKSQDLFRFLLRCLDLNRIVKRNFQNSKFLDSEFLIPEESLLLVSKSFPNQASPFSSLSSLSFLVALNCFKKKKFLKFFPIPKFQNFKNSSQTLPFEKQFFFQKIKNKDGLLVSSSPHSILQFQFPKKFNFEKSLQISQFSYRVTEVLEIQIVKKGKRPRQGVGFLEDGSLVVVINGQAFIGYRIRVKIIKILQTNTGRIFFCKKQNSPFFKQKP